MQEIEQKLEKTLYNISLFMRSILEVLECMEERITKIESESHVVKTN